MTKVLITGDRNWSDKELILNTLLEYSTSIDLVIEGGARGADALGRQVAEYDLDLDVLEITADWNKYGKSAGPRRNKQMLIEGKPDLVVWFHKDIGISKGTANMISQAEAAGIAAVSGEKSL